MPIAMDMLGVFSSSARQFLSSLGHRISTSSGEAMRDMFSLPEYLGVVAALQRCPTPQLLAGIRLSICTYLLVFFSFFSQIPREYTYRGYKK